MVQTSLAVVSTIHDKPTTKIARKVAVGAAVAAPVGTVAGALASIGMWAAATYLFPPALFLASPELQVPLTVLTSTAVGAIVTGLTTWGTHFATSYMTAPDPAEGVKLVQVPR